MKQNSTNKAEDKAMQAFADILIQRLESVKGNWQQPWVSINSSVKWPRNMDGREYSNINAMVLMMHTQLSGYTAPIYATFDRISKLNFVERKDKKFERVKDAEGKELPMVKVNKGAKSMPVVKTVYNPVHKENKTRIPFSEYMKLSDEEKKEYDLFPRKFVYLVFNIDQTNLKETRPEFYEKLVGLKEVRMPIDKVDEVHFPAVDIMISRDLWQCPIEVEPRSTACYSPASDKVMMPEKEQFKYSEGFYGTLFHECAHSTGAKHRYERNLGCNDSKAYAKEELIAELTAALVASKYGLVKHIKSDSLPYLKNWLQKLKEEPEFIKTLLNDVKKASSQIIRRIDIIQKRMEELMAKGINPYEVDEFLKLDPTTKQPLADLPRYYVKEIVEVEA